MAILSVLKRQSKALLAAIAALFTSTGTSHAGLDNELSLVDGQDRTLTIQQWDTFLNGVFPLDRNRLTREWFHSGRAAYIVAGEGADELCVIGGGEIYRLLLDQATDLHLTWVDTEVNADTHFPEVDATLWREADSQAHTADERHAFAFRFVHYVRR